MSQIKIDDRTKRTAELIKKHYPHATEEIDPLMQTVRSQNKMLKIIDRWNLQDLTSLTEVGVIALPGSADMGTFRFQAFYKNELICAAPSMVALIREINKVATWKRLLAIEKQTSAELRQQLRETETQVSKHEEKIKRLQKNVVELKQAA